MKSKTSSFNRTVFQKDLTRFAPCWAAYTIVLLLVMVSLTDDSQAYYRVRNIGQAINLMAWANLIYAAVVAQLLFGDLYNSRLCNALHAMPVTRGGWFGTHTASAVAFSVLPNLIVALLALIVLDLGAGWSAVFWWVAASELQYIFFLGVAVLCVMLAGNRLGQLALYAMINFASLLAGWLANAVYEPLLYGIQIDTEAFYPFCPLAQFSEVSDVLVIDYERIENELGEYLYLYGVAPGEGWGYMALCAGLGILALVAALVLYRKRKLECAGDFVAFSKMEPVVQVLVTIFAGGFFHLFGDVFGMNMAYVMLAVGAVVGFFACRMLMKRTTRVFQKKAFLGCGAIVAVFALTLVLTYFDPVGVTRYVPEVDEVESVKFSDSYSLYRHEDFPFEAVETQDIEAILGVHQDCIVQEASSQPGGTEESYSTFNLRLEYTLKNGKTVNRFYTVHPLSEAGQVLKGYFTKPECVLGFPAEDVPVMADYIRSIYFDEQGGRYSDLSELDLDGLLAAIVADCEAGNMAQRSGYHYPSNYDLLDGEYDTSIAYVDINWDAEGLETASWSRTEYGGTTYYSSIRVYRSCVNTLKWLEDNDLLTEEHRNELGGVTATFTTG